MSSLYEYEFFSHGFMYNRKGIMAKCFVKYDDITGIRMSTSSLRFNLTQYHLTISCTGNTEIHLKEEPDVTFDDIYYKINENWLNYLKNPYAHIDELINKKFAELILHLKPTVEDKND